MKADELSILMENVNYIKDKIRTVPKVAVVLGSGLGSFADSVSDSIKISYSELESFPVSTVSGHAGKFVFTEIYGLPVVLMQGRIHYYEGYSMNEVVRPIRLLKLLGVEKIILTNAAGGLHSDWEAGVLMMITGHISSFVPSPLVGPNIDALGVRFPDMSNIYDVDFRQIVLKSAEEENIPLKKGVYVQTSGPNYETPEEIRMYQMLGADAVGMSTACEATAAVHCGLKVCGISCITNKAAGISSTPLSHEEVKAVADRVSLDFKRLIYRILYNLREDN